MTVRRRVTFAAVLLAVSLTAVPASGAVRYRRLTPAQLDKVTAPVALYPDVLLVRVLAAATHPLDVALAAQWLGANPTPTDEQIAAQPWDASVRSLVHYPGALKLLAGDLAWTRQLGLAYANQRADVTRSIQRLRVKARITGTLTDTPEQAVVVVENHYIVIEPAEPEVVYVPVYDPATCYTHRCPPRFEHPRHPAPPSDPPPAEEEKAPAPVGVVKVRTAPPARTIYSEERGGVRRTYSPVGPAIPTPPAPPTPAVPPAPADTPAPERPAAQPAPAPGRSGAISAPARPERRESIDVRPVPAAHREERRPSVAR